MPEEIKILGALKTLKEIHQAQKKYFEPRKIVKSSNMILVGPKAFSTLGKNFNRGFLGTLDQINYCVSSANVSVSICGPSSEL